MEPEYEERMSVNNPEGDPEADEILEEGDFGPVTFGIDLAQEPDIAVNHAPKQPTPLPGVIYGCRVLNVRKEPHVSSEVVTVLKPNTLVEIKGQVEDWTAITVPDYDIPGWVMTQFIKEV